MPSITRNCYIDMNISSVIFLTITGMKNYRWPRLGFNPWIGLLFVILFATGAEASVDFSGLWHQDVSRSVPPGNPTRRRELDIQQAGNVLTVKVSTETSRGARALHLEYEIGGRELVYTGLDGDEFHTKVRWEGENLVFDTIEHERGSEIVSQQIWSLAEGGKLLREVKRSKTARQPAESVAIFEKVQASPK